MPVIILPIRGVRGSPGLPLHALPPASYLAFLHWATTPGQDAATHVARLSLGSRTITAYVKEYVSHCTNGLDHRGPVNEVAGYFMAEAAGISVPATAGVVTVDRAKLPGGRAGTFVAWWCEDAGADSIKARLNLGALPQNSLPWNIAINHARDFLRRRPEVCSLIALDELVGNIDRNLGNLLLSPGNLIAIDHGRIFSGPCWTRSTLDPAISYMNTIRTLLGIDVAPDNVRTKLHMVASRVALAVRKSAHGLGKWLDAFLDPADRASAEAFIATRTTPGKLQRLLGFLS